MIDFEERLTEEQLATVRYIISKMGIEIKPTINEFMNYIVETAAKYGLVEGSWD